jgi:hypothetical protein
VRDRHDRAGAERGQRHCDADRATDHDREDGPVPSDAAQPVRGCAPAPQGIARDEHRDAEQQRDAHALADQPVELVRRKMGRRNDRQREERGRDTADGEQPNDGCHDIACSAMRDRACSFGDCRAGEVGADGDGGGYAE